MSIDPATGKPYYGTFPFITVRDMVNAHFLLADHLGIASAHAVVGSSIGGFQALEMALTRPNFARKTGIDRNGGPQPAVAIAFNESQRMAIETDASFDRKTLKPGKKGVCGFPVDRSAQLPRFVGLQRHAAGKRQPVQNSRIPGDDLPAIPG